MKNLAVLLLTILTLNCFGAGATVSSLNGSATNLKVFGGGNVVFTNDMHPTLSITGRLNVGTLHATNEIIDDIATNTILAVSSLFVTNTLSVTGDGSENSSIFGVQLWTAGDGADHPFILNHTMSRGGVVADMESVEDGPYYWNYRFDQYGDVTDDGGAYSALFNLAHYGLAGHAVFRFNGSSYQLAGDNRGLVLVATDFGTNDEFGNILEILTRKSFDAATIPSALFSHPIRFDFYSGTMMGAISESIHTIGVPANSTVEIVGAPLDMPQFTLDDSGSDDPVNLVPIDAVYDGSGNYFLGYDGGDILTKGLYAGHTYTWQAGVNDTSYSNGAGNVTTPTFTKNGFQLFLHGAAGQPVTAIVMLKPLNGEFRNNNGVVSLVQNGLRGDIVTTTPIHPTIPVSVTVGVSPFVFSNATLVKLQCYIDSTVTAYSIQKNGSTIRGSSIGFAPVEISPTNTITITYSGAAPTLKTNADW